jgi:hypothetical protein
VPNFIELENAANLFTLKIEAEGSLKTGQLFAPKIRHTFSTLQVFTFQNTVNFN